MLIEPQPNGQRNQVVTNALKNLKHVKQQIAFQHCNSIKGKLSAQLENITRSDSSAIRLLDVTHFLQCQELLAIIKSKYDELRNGPIWTEKELALFNISTQLPDNHVTTFFVTIINTDSWKNDPKQGSNTDQQTKVICSHVC